MNDGMNEWEMSGKLVVIMDEALWDWSIEIS